METTLPFIQIVQKFLMDLLQVQHVLTCAGQKQFTAKYIAISRALNIIKEYPSRSFITCIDLLCYVKSLQHTNPKFIHKYISEIQGKIKKIHSTCSSNQQIKIIWISAYEDLTGNKEANLSWNSLKSGTQLEPHPLVM